MKKLSIICIAVTGIIMSGCAELGMLIPAASPSTGALTTEEVIRGLKEALTLGAANSATSASVPDGFFSNPLISIAFPPEAIKVKNTLEQAGFTNLVRDFEKSLNRAAEEASKKSLPIFKRAITGMTITDAMNILQGSGTAATVYLRTKTETDLRKEFSPVVKSAIQTVEVTRYWNPVASAYNTATLLTGGARVNPNLEDYITQKTLDGLFLLIAQEEQEIRRDPAARVTDILKRVFGARG